MDTVTTPTVDGLPTTLHRLTHEELKHSPLLEPLYLMINAAFGVTSVAPYFPDIEPIKRLVNSAQLVTELGSTAVTFILTQSTVSPEGHVDLRLLGTVTLEVHDEDGAAAHADADYGGRGAFDTIMYQDSPPFASTVAHRVVHFLAVDPSLMGKGLASWLMKHLEAEAIAQLQRERLEEGKAWTTLRMVLSTINEINGKYYGKRGWKTLARREMPPGFLGSPGGFTLVRMEKVLDL
ncbi:hypothetical protein EXIGLDRAFT_729814 [Exidia glandulosa HHB12029]|uniref:N-acetyltransferase domain-containing protein n=1 Tax=Exidia glandulosa HHB12029 TaxID=1314781 RepID=A0A165CF60_EXIGL|nr:hypothetical protein EXIGLDRAFT_729814 [Exidia glandulosa HHB12029]